MSSPKQVGPFQKSCVSSTIVRLYGVSVHKRQFNINILHLHKIIIYVDVYIIL